VWPLRCGPVALSLMSTIKLYHKDVYMPPGFVEGAKKVHFSKLVWSRHAQLEILNDQYGVVPRACLPGQIFGELWELIEAEVTGSMTTKFVFRRDVDSTRSLVIVVRPEFPGSTLATVCTAWTNLKSDKHDTLDKSKYVQPPTQTK
jgi:hypothetical protein